MLVYYFYNYKLKFVKEIDKNILSKNKIYFISNYKLKQIKKYLKNHLKKSYIIFNYISFALSILFIKKPNNEFKFYVNY